MQLPDFIEELPSLDVPFSSDVVSTRAFRSDDGLVVFFRFHKDMDLPPHAHGPQWGTVLKGEVVFTIGHVTQTYRSGESYDIPSGIEHSAKIKAGTVAIDIFAEADRYPLLHR